MRAGHLYNAADPDIQAEQHATLLWLARYNASFGQPVEVQQALLAERMGRVGIGVVVRPPFHCDYGSHIHLADNVFINYGSVILDVCDVMIGEGAQIGPGVHIYAADHPRDLESRRKDLEFGRPVGIGAHVWIGGGAIILPGVTIGEGAIIGAGSVVTRDVAAGSTVAGNPARIITSSRPNSGA